MTEHIIFAAESLAVLLLTGGIVGYVLKNWNPDYRRDDSDEDQFP
jgi:uncharacterized membrane protein (UPF0136 family)